MAIQLPGVLRGVGNVVRNASVAQQVVAAATRTYLAGSALAAPPGGWTAGTRLRWRFNMTKTAAGIAASTFDICFGTAGTVADTARVSFAKPAGTAAADEGFVDIEAVIRSVSATGVVAGTFKMDHNLAATGHATIPTVTVTTVSGAFDLTVDQLIAGVCLTSGAADAITVELVTAEATSVQA